MYNFIICEDNFNTGILLKKIITEYANEKNLDYNIKLFNENFDQVIEFTKSISAMSMYSYGYYP